MTAILIVAIFRPKRNLSMNLWMGQNPTGGIVDEWDKEMTSWPAHIFRCASFSKMGIASSYDDRTQSFIIVVEYS